jgi:hypothetical protein
LLDGACELSFMLAGSVPRDSPAGLLAADVRRSVVRAVDALDLPALDVATARTATLLALALALDVPVVAGDTTVDALVTLLDDAAARLATLCTLAPGPS